MKLYSYHFCNILAVLFLASQQTISSSLVLILNRFQIFVSWPPFDFFFYINTTLVWTVSSKHKLMVNND